MELTREQVLVMKAGREMDMLIASKVMGLELEEGKGMFELSPIAKYFDPDVVNKPNLVVKDETAIGGQKEIPKYSTDIAEAWEVAERFQSYQLTKMHNVGSEKETKYRAIVKANKHAAYAETGPLAMCRAALLTTIKEEWTCSN